MSLYKIEINTESKAFRGLCEPGMEAMEVSRILEELADQLNRTGVLLNQHLFDAKGLLCGRAYIEKEGDNGET